MSEKLTLTLDVACLYEDCQDGSWNVKIYNDLEELLSKHRLAKGGVLSIEDRQAILNEEDPYENGYIAQKRLTFVLENGALKLHEPIHMHFGQ